MSGRILVAADGSPLATRALTYALETFPDADITVVHVIDPVNSLYDAETHGPSAAEQWADDARERAREIHDAAESLAAEHGVELSTATRTGRPADEILDYAAEAGCDGIVIGSHGRRGVDRILLGSVAERVSRNAQIPVTVVA